MAEPSDDVERLYECGERLNEAKDKSQHAADYEGIIKATQGSIKAKQLSAQLIPRFFKYFPNLRTTAIDALFDLCEHEELGVRVQAIRGLPLLCKDTTEYVSKIVVLVAQMLNTEENVERDAVQKALLSLLRQDVKASLTALFNFVECADEGTDENTREKVLTFIKEKVFPIKSELLKPQEQMERHITDLIKKSLNDVSDAEFKMFVDFLSSLSIFGDKAPPERVQELLEIIESQADLHVEFNISGGDEDHLQRILICLDLAIPFFQKGASNSRFLNYVTKHLIPVFDKLPEGQKSSLLKVVAESSPYTAPKDSRQVLPSIMELLKKYMPRKKEEIALAYPECLLYTFHQLAAKAPNATNSLCGYKIVTGQPSDRLGEDFSECNKDFMERLTCIEEIARGSMKKLTQGMNEHNKAIAAAMSDEAKEKIKKQQQNATVGLRTCNNILAMTKSLHAKSPSFIGDKRINLSWKEATKPTTTPGSGVKRSGSTSANGSNNFPAKKGRGGGGGFQNQLMNRALEGISYGGRGGGYRSDGGRGRGFRGRGRGYM